MYTRTSTVLERLRQNPYCTLISLNNLYVIYECSVKKVHYIFSILDGNHLLPIRVAAPSQAWIYGRSLAGNAGSNPAGSRHVVTCECCVLLGTGLCVGLINLPEESYSL